LVSFKEVTAMTRRDTHMDAMLRHLGAAYYESLHGRASAADVARARTAIEEGLTERPATIGPAAHGRPRRRKAPGPPHHHGRFHSTVRDVTTDVVAVDRITPYKEIASLLAEQRISAVPVLVMGRHVAGVVSEDDLLAARDRVARWAQTGKTGHLPWTHHPGRQRPKLTAEELMSSPAITINPDAPIPRAARLLHDHHIKRLPVVDPDGRLIGIVSRRDLLRVFLRSDTLIAQQVRELLAEILLTEPEGITAVVHGGVVTLTSQHGPEDQGGLIPVAVRLIWDIDGVVNVVDNVSTAAPTSVTS
jgi:CBS domain-containing protein